MTIITKTGLIERFHSRIVNGIGHEAIYLTHGLDATVDLFKVALVRAVVYFEEETLHTTTIAINFRLLLLMLPREDDCRGFGVGGALFSNKTGRVGNLEPN